MSQFHLIKTAVAKQFDKIKDWPLFYSNADRNRLWDTYVETLTTLGQNEIYRERGEHDCECCKHFIRKIGNIVALSPEGSLVSIWDIEPTGTFYDLVAEQMSKLTRRSNIRSAFFIENSKVGTDSNVELIDGQAHTWEHFYVEVPSKYVIKDGTERASRIGRSSERYHSLKLSCEKLKLSAVMDVLALIDEDNLYRGAEHKHALNYMKGMLKDYAEAECKQMWMWRLSLLDGDKVNMRGSVIGTLVEDISSGVDLDVAVKSFETKVAPANYKRPTALITKGMIEAAQKTVEALGISDSLLRRHALITDISVDNVMHADRSAKAAMKGDVFATLKAKVQDNVSLDSAVSIPLDTFVSNVLPTVSTVEAYLENNLIGNLMTLMAPADTTAPNILKWENNFTWVYRGGVTDSMREAVVAAGGRVDGVFRFTHSWNHTGRNQSLMDLHVFLPTHNGHKQGTHFDYGNEDRVGWNNRRHLRTAGVQDVDFTSEPGTKVPLENITFPKLSLLPDGKYTCKVHNWKARTPNETGFKAEIEFEGQVFEYSYDKPLANKEWVTVAEVTLRNGKFSIEHKIPCGSAPQEVWGITTKKFHRVSVIMNSPNHWDGQGVGNKHCFFILADAKNPDEVRGLFNEYLSDALQPHRKVLEVIGNQLKAEYSDQQLSGLGFSSTVRNSLIVRVTENTGKTRLYNIQF